MILYHATCIQNNAVVALNDVVSHYHYIISTLRELLHFVLMWSVACFDTRSVQTVPGNTETRYATCGNIFYHNRKYNGGSVCERR